MKKLARIRSNKRFILLELLKGCGDFNKTKDEYSSKFLAKYGRSL